MAAVAGARSFLRSASVRNAAANIASGGRKTAAARASAFLRPSGVSRIAIRSPAEMSSFCLESLLPMHSVTASALLTSMLSVSQRRYGWLLEVGNDDV